MGMLIDGIWYKDEAAAKKHLASRSAPIARQARVFEMSQEAQKFDRELIQPYTADGKPNPEFIKHYPKESIEYGFIEERK